MEYEIVSLPEKVVVGIAARTNNSATDMGMVIGGLWKRFYGEGVYESILDKSDEKAIGLYTDYAGDATDDYTAMVCCVVGKKPEDSPYEIRKIPAGRYAKFVIFCDMRTAVTAVAKAWQEIWKIVLPRTFICDFEEYQNDDMEHTEIHLYIGLKEKEKDEI